MYPNDNVTGGDHAGSERNGSERQRSIAAGRILIADDEVALTRPLAELFRREGFEPVCVGDGVSAIEAVRRSDFDLLIADVGMPGNSGLEMVTTVRGLCRGLPIVVLTGSPTVLTAAKSVELAILAYLIKPPNFDQLLQLANQAVLNSRAARLARESRSRLQSWVAELERMERDFGSGRAVHGVAPADFVSSALGNLLGSITDVQNAVRLLNESRDAANMLRSAEVLHALRRTIDVLEQTKRSFKSTELRDLRVEVEQVLQMVARNGPPPEKPV